LHLQFSRNKWEEEPQIALLADGFLTMPLLHSNEVINYSPRLFTAHT
jgi:hypothetical protein